MAQSARRTVSRRELERHQRFEQVSPEVGMLDEEAFAAAMGDDPDAALALLADLAGATDRGLRELARHLAGKLFFDLARSPGHKRGVGRMRAMPYSPDAGDIDLDASLDALLSGRAGSPDAAALRVRSWVRPTTALCLVVDRSGSMGGKALANAALAAAAVAMRAPTDYSVLAFGQDVLVAKGQTTTRAAEGVVHDLLALRGFGTTDLAAALREAGGQLARSTAGRKLAVLLSDCRSTAGDDPAVAARACDELVVLAPQSDDSEARQFAASVGARFYAVAGPAQIADVISRALQRTA